MPAGPFAFTAVDVDPQVFHDALRTISIPLDLSVIDRQLLATATSSREVVSFIAGQALALALGTGVVQLTDPQTWPRSIPGDWIKLVPPALAKEADRG